ncbi:3'-5' exonuclease [Synechococcus sp. Cruz-9H2]|uniref:3'-5' exonuclease n=1 Tax=unclassified Synechococcus TaxID=2626047 RepID=UPI0020CED526|nr:MULTISPECIES: 3'-5' exonuclease [unclassified Synechococcus]MCP9819841.1 3'-5' exonuclease [Synechococcus sp. Cruz-9H2]MCP9844093.1 3'-5' exonuclease [Synechococcus sp. Edmonson 11F2]MCP9856271.1 3'-5' exonuclease [Synechococcus sp. Cruz-9C9]MCP9863556.1 3'-5' exonuclease [Synechococcus sp. Cruz-7E5]MCP9870752.1 3'-5' exonuclease [Synechococcus sp. Cruz-7B9]
MHTTGPQLLLLLDCETTGLDPDLDQLVEVGAVLFSVPHRAVLQQLSVLLPVEQNAAEAINGISPAITHCSIAVDGFMALLVQLACSADALVAHNAAFDRQWLDPLLVTSTKPWICTMSGISWPDLRPNPSVTALALAHGIPVWAAHRALTDCSYLAQVLERAPGLEDLLAEGLLPRSLCVANVSFEQRQQAKDHGFRWLPDRKQWQRELTEAQIDALPFNVTRLEPPPC